MRVHGRGGEVSRSGGDENQDIVPAHAAQAHFRGRCNAYTCKHPTQTISFDTRTPLLYYRSFLTSCDLGRIGDTRAKF